MDDTVGLLPDKQRERRIVLFSTVGGLLLLLAGIDAFEVIWDEPVIDDEMDEITDDGLRLFLVVVGLAFVALGGLIMTLSSAQMSFQREQGIWFFLIVTGTGSTFYYILDWWGAFD